MPLQQIVPTWLAWNNANFTSPTGLTDIRTGQQFPAGGLNLGDYFDATNDEAASASYTNNGLLFAGRYRLVLVDSGATAANVKTGTVGYLRNGSTVKSVRITSAGSGQTNGTYTVNANFGAGGTGAVVTVVISGGLVTSAVVTNGGYGYTSVPTFTIAQGGTPGTIVAQLSTSPNLVTSYDQVSAGIASAVRPVVFLNSITPGNYGFVQELGTATVLGNGTIGGGNSPGGYCNTASGGTVATTAASGSPIGSTIGVAIDTPLASNLFKIQLGYAAMTVQD